MSYELTGVSVSSLRTLLPIIALAIPIQGLASEPPQPRQLTPVQDQLARKGQLLDMGECVMGSTPGDVCVLGICFGCEAEATQTVYRCDADLACMYVGLEPCYGDQCLSPDIRRSIRASSRSAANLVVPEFLNSPKARIADTGGSVDAIRVMNDLLASKGAVKKRRTVTRKEWVCDGGPPCTDDNFFICEKCRKTEVEYPEEYAEPLRVVAAGVAPIKAVNVEWGTPDYQSVPEYANFTSTFATNCSSEKGNVSTTLSMTESATNSVTVSRSVSTGSSINADLRLNIGKVGSIGTGVRVDRRVTVTQGQTTSETESITRSQTVSIPVRGWSALTMRYGLRRGTGVVPFDAVMTLDGPVDSNLEGFKRISEVLSPEERTFKAKGHVTVEAVSDLDVTWIEDPKKLSAEDPICRERKQPGIGFEERVILIK